jgi:hypothetical protein
LGKDVDAIDFYTAKLQHLDQTILEARKKEYPATPLAFVTFEKVSGAVRPFFGGVSDGSNWLHSLCWILPLCD